MKKTLIALALLTASAFGGINNNPTGGTGGGGGSASTPLHTAYIYPTFAGAPGFPGQIYTLRFALTYSGDGNHFRVLPNTIDLYTPPLNGGNVVGGFNPFFTKNGSTYILGYIPYDSTGANVATFSVANSSNLQAWTHVVDVTDSNNIGEPKFFTDSANGNLYAVGGGKILQNTSGDGVTWATPSTTMKNSGGSSFGTSEDCLTKRGNTYIYFARTGAGNTYHIWTSTALTTGYTDAGAVTGWLTGEGMAVVVDAAGVYHAYWDDLSGSLGTLTSMSTTPETPASWSTPIALSSFANNFNGGFIADTGGVWGLNDQNSINDINAAFATSSPFNSAQPSPYSVSPLALNQWLNLGTTPIKTGVGTVTWSGTGFGFTGTLAGTGTFFTSQLKIGSMIVIPSNNRYGTVTAIASDTALTATCNSSSGLGSAVAFTFRDPVLTQGNSTGQPALTVSGQGTSNTIGQMMVAPRMFQMFDKTQTACWFSFGSGGTNSWALTDEFTGGTTPLVVDVNIGSNVLHLTSTGPTTTGNLTFSTAGKGIIGGVTATLPSVGNVGEQKSTLVASGSAVSMTTATATNICSVSLTAGHWLVTFNANTTATGATTTLAAPMIAGISATSATLPTDGTEGYNDAALTLAMATQTIPCSGKFINVTGTTTIFGVAQATFSAGTVVGFGALTAVRLP